MRRPSRTLCVRRLALLAAGALAGALPARRASAQYAVAPVQQLAFGYLTQGLTEVVPYTDTFRRGVVNVDGTGQVYIRLVLPTALTSFDGATIPLQFLAGDMAAQEAGRAPSAFDPAGSTRVNLSKGTATLFVGGRAVPAPDQRAGVYSATMTIIVSPTKF
jgi:hypothetical protein